jgi:hypothetical protein
MNKTLIHCAAFLAAAAGAVHIIVLISVEGLALSPLTAALAASIVFALVTAAGPVPRNATVRHEGLKPIIATIFSHISKASAIFVPTLIAVLIVLWPMTAIFGHATDFYCTPAVPWRIEIVVFGAFVISMLKHMAGRLPYANTLEILIYVSLFWIAPFYGFFSAPYFLGMNIVAPCPDRRILEIILASAAMVMASALAEAVGAFLRSRK